MKIRLRNPSPLDVEAVYSIEVASFEHPHSKLVIMSQLILHSDTSLVAEHKGKVIGYAIAAKEVNKRLHLLNFAVHPEYRGLGIGKALLRALERLAKNVGAREIYLEVEHDNLRAIALYEKMGYKKERVIKGYYPWGKDAIVMVKRLA